MASPSRRAFLKSAAVGAAAVAVPAWLRARAVEAAETGVLDKLGVALYTVRDQMTADAAGTLKAIAGLGYHYIEGGLRPSLADAARAAGLQQKSAYAPTYLVTGNRQAWAGDGPLLPEDYKWQHAVEEAKSRALEYLVVVYLKKAERGGLDVYRDLARKLAAAGEACKKAGLGLAYHAHSFEFEPMDGTRPIDVLLGTTPGELLGLELDTFWSSIGGVDPVTMVEKHAGRVPLVHLKDKARGTAVQYDEGKVPREAFKEVGNGEIDYRRFFTAAEKAGVRYYYVEQDYTVGSTPLESLKVSRQAVATASARTS
jgi:sugar phosphate isomerase/epimerase